MQPVCQAARSAKTGAVLKGLHHARADVRSHPLVIYNVQNVMNRPVLDGFSTGMSPSDSSKKSGSNRADIAYNRHYWPTTWFSLRLQFRGFLYLLEITRYPSSPHCFIAGHHREYIGLNLGSSDVHNCFSEITFRRSSLKFFVYSEGLRRDTWR